MVSLNPPDAHIIKLTQDEQMALLQHCNCVNDETRRMLFSAQDGLLTLTTQQCIYLRRAIEMELEKVSDNRAAEALGSAYNKLCVNPVMHKISEKLGEMSFESIEDAQKAADQVMFEQNNAPDPGLGGLTPVQTHRLIYTEWDKPDCPMKLNEKFGYEEIKNVPLYRNTMILLQELMHLEKENTATAKGNLSRKVVLNIVDKLGCNDDFPIPQIIQTSKKINEHEITYLWKTRLICQAAGLIRKSNNKFLVTGKGQELLESEKAGKLYRLLFLTYMRKLNIGFSDRMPPLPGLQSTMAYTLYHLGHIAKTEVKLEDIYRRIILPAVLDEVDQIAKVLIRASFIIRHRVIEPLEYAGLLDCHREKVKFFPEITSLKISPLFRNFVSFKL